MPIHRLSSDDLEKEYKLIAIHSDIEPYKLAFEINKKLKIQLKRSSFDLSFKNQSSIFDLYKHIFKKSPLLVWTYSFKRIFASCEIDVNSFLKNGLQFSDLFI